MPLAQIIRLESGANATFVALDRATAISQALAGVGTIATVVSRNPQWPQLMPYTNDNSSFSTDTPSYVWDSFTTVPQTRFFAISSGFIAAGISQILVDLRVFCDNAHDVQIQIYNAATNALVATMTPAAGLIDGSLDPAAGSADDVPFNWLNIRYYSNTAIALDLALAYKVVISFQAVNYNNSFIPPGTPNPAGLAFAADIYAGI